MNKNLQDFDVLSKINSIIYQTLSNTGLSWESLSSTDPSFINLKVIILKKRLNDQSDQLFVDSIYALMYQRWSAIKIKNSSYAAEPDTVQNKVFIAIAQFLVSEKLVKFTHYYQLIMPSVRNFEIPSSLYFQNVTDIEVQNLLLTDDDYLLDASEIMDDFAVSGKLRVQTTKGMRAPTATELTRIAAHPSKEIAARFREVLARYRPCNLGLTKQTVEAVWSLACGVTLSGGNHFFYSQRQNNHSYRAVLRFQEYLDTMPSQERAVLWGYLITRPESTGSLPTTFAAVWQRMTAGQECIYGMGKYYHKLAYDFLRDFGYCNIFNSVTEVLDLQKVWRSDLPEVLEFVSPALYVDTPENILALKKMNVIEYDIKFRSWDNDKIPSLVFNVLKLIENERNQQHPNWEGVLCKTLKLFKHQALKQRSFWVSQDAQNWYRRFLNDDYLNQFVQVEEKERSDSEEEPVVYRS